MPCGNREADLVVQLGRRWDVAFLLDMKSHAGGPGCNAATIRSESAGDNCLCVRELVTISNSASSHWVDLTSGAVPLHCCWTPVTANLCDMGDISIKYRVFIVLSEFYGSNGWVRRVADRLAAAAGLLALKMQLLQKRRLGLICPIWIRIWRSVDAIRPSPRRRHHLAATFDHLRHPRSPDPCRPWPQGWQRLLAGIRPGGSPLWRR